MSSNKCLSKSKSENLDFHSTYRCKTCKKSFKKFIFFEGHFAFNAYCRARSGWFMQCYVCGQKFHYLAELTYHLRRHVIKKSEIKPTASLSVNRSVKNKRKLRTKAYLTVEHTDTESHSTETTTNRNSTQINGESIAPAMHSATHNKFRCEKCNLSFTTDISLQLHQKLFHQNSSPNNASQHHQCNVCYATFSYSHNLVRHKQVHINGEEECQICHIKFTKKTLALHERQAHPELMDANESDEIQRDKRQSDTATPPIATPQLTSTNINQLITSIEITPLITLPDVTPSITSPSTSFQNAIACEQCERSFTSFNHLRQHLKAHRRFSCEICDKILYTRSSFEKHKRSHKDASSTSSQNTHVCKECEKSFATFGYLRMHLQAHQEYPCKICNAILYTRTTLRDHERSHSFECYICRADFPSLKTLDAHIQKHIVYEKWIDPMNIHLSNWSPTKSREILQNQPLVMVKNLNIKKMNFDFSVNLDRPTKEESAEDESKIPSDQLPSITENETDVSSIGNSDLPLELPMNVEESEPPPPPPPPAHNYRINIKLKYSDQTDPHGIYDDKQKKKLNEADSPIVDVDLVLSDDEILIVEEEEQQQHVISTTFDEDNNYDGKEVVDISSESEVEDILEMFHCYFCNKTFRSLDTLGRHVNNRNSYHKCADFDS